MGPTTARITNLWRGGWRGNQRRIAITAIAAGAVIAITAAAIAWTVSSPTGTPQRPTTTSAVPGTAAPGQPGGTSPDASGTSSTSPSTSSTPGGSAPDGSAPDGRISLQQLTSVPVDLPMWGSPVPGDDSRFPQCPTKGVRLNHSDAEWKPTVVQLGYTDVDHDGAVETVARLDCPVYQAARQQVVVFDRNAEGAIVVLGQVIRQGVGSVAIKMIYEFAVDDRTGSVRVQVSDRMPCCGADDSLAEHQWRTYAWDGQAFQQTGGPTAFHPIPASFGKPVLTITPLVLGPAASGKRTGTVTFSVTNAGPEAAPGVRVGFTIHSSGWEDISTKVQITARGATCAMERTRNLGDSLFCHHPSLAAGAMFTFTVTVISPVANDSLISGGHIRGTVNPEQPGIRVLESGIGEPLAEAPISIAT